MAMKLPTCVRTHSEGCFAMKYSATRAPCECANKCGQPAAVDLHRMLDQLLQIRIVPGLRRQAQPAKVRPL